MLIDTYGRVATDLRVSLTDRAISAAPTACPKRAPVAGQAGPADGRRDRPPRPHRRHPPRHHRDPLHRRRAPAAPRPGRIVERVAALEPRPRISLTTNGIGLQAHGTGAQDGGPRPGERVTGHAPPRRLQDPDPPRPPQGRHRGPWPPPTRRASPGEDQLGPDAGAERGRGPLTSSPGPSTTTTSSASSSRCPSTPSTAGSATA